MTTKEKSILKFSVPIFVLAGMARSGDNYKASVIEHSGTTIKLSVGGGEFSSSITNQNKFYKPKTELIFDPEGNLINTDGDDVFLPAPVKEAKVKTGGGRSGAAPYRKERLF